MSSHICPRPWLRPWTVRVLCAGRGVPLSRRYVMARRAGCRTRTSNQEPRPRPLGARAHATGARHEHDPRHHCALDRLDTGHDSLSTHRTCHETDKQLTTDREAKPRTALQTAVRYCV
eukprot:4410289-Prymnesium_polylepis.2